MQVAAILDTALAAVAATWALADLALVRDVLCVPRLARTRPARTPRVTAVVPARDEAGRIEGSVRRLLVAEGVEIDVVVVDDRSTDGTGALVERLSAQDARVRLARVEALPAGWLGKPHACQIGGELARGEWILFTDGDVHLDPDVIARAVAAGDAAQVEHVVLTPGVEHPTPLASAALAAFALGLVGALARANRDERLGWAGIGAFNLVRAEAWRAIGGHAQLSFEVVDDMKLGLVLRRAGFRTRGFLGQGALTAAWGRSAREVVQLLEKNLFAFLCYRAPVAFGIVLLGTLAVLAGALGWLTGTWPGSAATLAWLALGIPAALGAARDGRSPFLGLLAPAGVAVILLAIARSTWRTLRQGGVMWRGTHYPLRELRARRVRGLWTTVSG
ncbi:MAG: glycosyltransferase [Planctomycetes bacterium]|nr:glycosyltransferase [Planctomycetota bacterium]